jgi:hypothetical protein
MRSYNSPLKVLSEMEESSVSSLSGMEGSEGADLQWSVTGAVKRNAPASGSTRMEGDDRPHSPMFASPTSKVASRSGNTENEPRVEARAACCTRF